MCRQNNNNKHLQPGMFHNHQANNLRQRQSAATLRNNRRPKEYNNIRHHNNTIDYRWINELRLQQALIEKNQQDASAVPNNRDDKDDNYKVVREKIRRD